MTKKRTRAQTGHQINLGKQLEDKWKALPLDKEDNTWINSMREPDAICVEDKLNTVITELDEVIEYVKSKKVKQDIYLNVTGRCVKIIEQCVKILRTYAK